MPRPPRPGRAGAARQAGAALLILLTLLALASASLLMNVMNGRAMRARAERLSLVSIGQARDAVIGYAMLYGRLPRPAMSATDGTENPAICDSDARCTGYLPWVTLGISPVDGWGHLLRYSVAPGYSQVPLLLDNAIASKTIQGRRGGQLFYVAGNAACSVFSQCLPAIIFSTGASNFGISAQGIAQSTTPSPYSDEYQNATASEHFIRRSYAPSNVTDGGQFDDLVEAVPLNILLNRMNKVGAFR